MAFLNSISLKTENILIQQSGPIVEESKEHYSTIPPRQFHTEKGCRSSLPK